MSIISRVSNQNGVSPLYIMLEIHHSGREPSIWIYVMSCVHPANQLAVHTSILHSKNFNVGHYRQTVPVNFLRSAMLIGTIDFYCFVPLSQALTLPAGHKVSPMQILLASFSQTLFI